MDQLKVAELKGWSADKLKEALSMEAGFIDRHGLDIMEQVEELSLDVEEVFYNASPGVLYEQALKHEKGSRIVSSGALAVKSGKKTGRSPLDKRAVYENGCGESAEDVWWGKVNIPLTRSSFLTNRERAVDYLNLQKRLYVIDGYGGWEEDFRVPVRVITSRAYHALFMQNMLVPPTEEELDIWHKEQPFIIFNAGVFPCNRQTDGMTSSTSIAVSFERREMVILGTQYAGEMKKGVFTIMNYLMPLQPERNLPPAERALPLHASANIGPENDVSIFFGLSGTGKTTLSADPKRDLIGDDEHVWHTKGVFNIEGGCDAKTIGLTREKEPEIYDAIRFGSILENVVFNPETGIVDYDDVSLTQNTRVPAKVSSQCSDPCQGLIPAQADHLAYLRCFRGVAAHLKADSRSGYVSLHLGIYSQGCWHRGRREGAR